MVQMVSRDPSAFRHYWGVAVRTTLLATVPMAAVVLLVAFAVLPRTISPLVAICVAISELLFTRLLDSAGQAFQSQGQLGKTAATSLIGATLRLAGAALFLALPIASDATSWAVIYLLSSMISATAACVWVSRVHGTPKMMARMTASERSVGFQYSVTQCAQLVYSEADKTLLVRLGSLQAAGTYAAATRVLDMLWIPVRSALWSSYARFFQVGIGGIVPAMDHARRLLRLALAYSAFAGVGLLAFAPVFPLLVGQDFAETATVLRWLSVLLALRSVHYIIGDALTGAGHQGFRSKLQAGAAGLNILLNLALIPRLSWHGAVWSALVTDGLLATAMVFTAAGLSRRDVRAQRLNASRGIRE
jgi:O-antigen/teichoic acid export membrane protein